MYQKIARKLASESRDHDSFMLFNMLVISGTFDGARCL
uniref:Uncharacterized protein n=1 Tax=Arundo donax TaxID=35708 RepID=A0A0A9DRE7_ARUDO